MTDDRAFRNQVHQAVDAYGAPAREDPFLLQCVLVRADRKEEPIMKKKLSTAAILVLVLLLLSMTALAIGLSVEEVWKQSFEKMNTTGLINNLSDETQAEIPMEEAIAIAREAIIAKYGTPESELDAMGVYPTYAARGWDGMTDDYPSEWDIYFSSRTNVDLDYDYTDYGPTGEYRVYINAETKEVTYCHWYTNDFWARAQTVWDCGSYDEVYWQYQKADFYNLPQDQQDYWVAQLAAREYDVVAADDKLHYLLRAGATALQFEPLTAIADNADPQVAAAWAALEAQYGLDDQTLQKYAYVATKTTWQTGTDDVCIHYAYEMEWDMISTGYLDVYSDWLFSNAARFGLYMVSFLPGTTEPAAFTHVTRSEDLRQTPVTEGGLLARTNWTADDLAAFDEAFERLDMGVKRMRAAGLANADMEAVVRDCLCRLGGTEWYAPVPDHLDTDSWFADESAWDAAVDVPALAYEEAVARYGHDRRFWPMEVQAALCAYDNLSVPREGEMTREEAVERALKLVVDTHGQEALDALGDYTVGCELMRHDGDGVCNWSIYITDDPASCQNGWRVVISQRDGEDWVPDTIQHITDNNNG